MVINLTLNGTETMSTVRITSHQYHSSPKNIILTSIFREQGSLDEVRIIKRVEMFCGNLHQPLLLCDAVLNPPCSRHDHDAQELQEKLSEKLQDILNEEKDVSVDVVLKIVQQYKTKQGIMNALMKKYPSADNKKSSKIYKTIKPLLSDKKGG